MKKYLLFALMMIFATQANASVKDLLLCIQKKDAAKLEKLLAAGEDVNAKNEQGNTALHYAVGLDNADLASVLLAHGADINATNSKGWSPLKIAEKKQAKNVMPLLLEAQKNAKSAVVEKAQKVAGQAKAAVAEVKNEAVQKTEKAAQQVQQVAQKTQQAVEQVTAPAEEMVPLAEAQAVIAQRELVAQEALQAKAQAEEKVKALEAKVIELEKAKEATQSAAKAAQQTAKNTKTASATVSAKPAATKPVQKAPVKKLPPQKSKLSDKIFAGDEDIVYCLNYLGQGENQHFLEAAGFYAASVGITEKRYNEIVDVANDYFAHTSEEGLKTRNDECSQIITPANKDKMNQIVHAINKSLGL
ncbi:MAG: ankyrin repeat domain-containing protein [Alphaproteobacteria bacterium]